MREPHDESEHYVARRCQDDAFLLRSKPLARGRPAERLLYVTDEGADHAERSWVRRFLRFTRFTRFIDWASARHSGSASGQESQ